jgi:predicted RNA binding protein YcfA (HicA-like mRNA interferase family)
MPSCVESSNPWELSALKYRDVVRLLEQDGWVVASQKGSHRKYKHPEKKGRVIVPYTRGGKDVPPGTLSSILKQAGLKKA